MNFIEKLIYIYKIFPVPIMSYVIEYEYIYSGFKSKWLQHYSIRVQLWIQRLRIQIILLILWFTNIVSWRSKECRSMANSCIDIGILVSFSLSFSLELMGGRSADAHLISRNSAENLLRTVASRFRNLLLIITPSILMRHSCPSAVPFRFNSSLSFTLSLLFLSFLSPLHSPVEWTYQKIIHWYIRISFSQGFFFFIFAIGILSRIRITLYIFIYLFCRN